MPVSRYLIYVGGALLALLFVVDACLPDRPATRGGANPSATIRIHSELKLPELVVLDTSQPTIAPMENAQVAPPGSEPLTTRAQEAFAEFLPPNAGRPQSLQSPKPEVKPQRPSRLARRHIEKRIRLVARPQQYGWFGSQLW